MYVVQNLIKSNLGPLLYDNDRISCSRKRTDLVECDVYAPFQTSCVCCQQLSDTFTPDTLSTMLNTTIDNVEIDCREPKRYSGCAPVAIVKALHSLKFILNEFSLERHLGEALYGIYLQISEAF